MLCESRCPWYSLGMAWILGKALAALGAAGMIVAGVGTAASASEVRVSTDWVVYATFGDGASCEKYRRENIEYTRSYCEENEKRGFWILWIEA